jgi:type II secretory pathway pseudopilin PulG
MIELLMIVAIILAMCAIAIPNVLRARMAANESSAVGALQTYISAEKTYASTYPSIGFATSFASLGPAGGDAVSSSAAGLLDNLLGCGAAACKKSGYSFTLTAGATTYNVTASPQVPASTGLRYFFTDQSGVIRYNAASPAGAGDNPI